MPELPEVETVRRTLAPRLVGHIVRGAELRCAAVLRRGKPAALGQGERVSELLRHGKQLAIVFERGRVVLVHLGMSGQLFVLRPGLPPPREDHLHARWSLDDDSTMWFRDPRRFGGLWAYPSLASLRTERWDALGPDGLNATAAALRRGAGSSSRAIKACLLDQSLLAGVGNIYADEALFAARLHPEQTASTLSTEDWNRLARHVRSVLRAGIRAGGSSLKDFVDAELRPGVHQNRFRVYGRRGFPCPECGTLLESRTVAQRTSTFCPHCQVLPKTSRPAR
ncbi:MAG: bifunctional DNA-formamidopyrimidine glycosylase/DNA-(apurinic or apyrimidinic site) lyase [Phycisphaerales bacterium]|nr:bifunctional DNA-formamidopyrimidine glycosylase/DNA-(apurinic or apyrimidinic site) lyase [Phycisphaerales bacterium]